MMTHSDDERGSSISIAAAKGVCDNDMLIEVDFKWLMAGQGCWIDPTRLHNDPGYAHSCLSSASHSRCEALRLCAARLQNRLCAQHAGAAELARAPRS